MKRIFKYVNPSLVLLGCLITTLVLVGEVRAVALESDSDVAESGVHKSANPAADIQLATHYKAPSIVSDYLVSEKLDGVRGFWDGKSMYTRSGRRIALAEWFTKGFPAIPLDGELWLGRGKFEAISALVRTSDPNPQLWQQVRFMVFDVPEHQGGFAERYQVAKRQIEGASAYLSVIDQVSLNSNDKLSELLASVVKKGGEGLMLHHKLALYRTGRNSQLMKLKPYYDAEAEVIGHKPGKGKFVGMTGALIVRTPSGQVFRLGSGLTQAQRIVPPTIGSIVTFQYHGYTSKGIPRFASFLRVKHPLKKHNPKGS